MHINIARQIWFFSKLNSHSAASVAQRDPEITIEVSPRDKFRSEGHPLGSGPLDRIYTEPLVVLAGGRKEDVTLFLARSDHAGIPPLVICFPAESLQIAIFHG